jgi:membrane associated rhomboid family serine protease
MAYNSSGNSFGRSTPVVLNLIIINVLVFLAQFLYDNVENGFVVTRYMVLFPFADENFKPYQLVSHMFAHDRSGFGHILFNMFNLYMFGSILEKVWGPKRFFIFYFACGLAAGIAQMLLVKTGVSLGASGAVMGLFAAYAYLFPNAELMLMFIPVPIKAKYMVAIMVAIDLFGQFGPAKTGIAHFAHLAGLLMGFILVLIWNKTNKKTFY